MVRRIKANTISEKVAEITEDMCTTLPEDIRSALGQALLKESNQRARQILESIIKNYQLGESKRIPICQDTGIMVVYANIGSELIIEGKILETAINEGLKEGYYRLRKSVVSDPLFARTNTQDNTPAIIHTKIIEGDQLELFLMPKGGGAENCSALKMLSPAQGISGVKEFVLDVVKNSAVNACPPIILGIGIGGNFETAPYLAKKALLRNIEDCNPNADYQQLETELLQEINSLNIGPAGIGGDTTALAVKMEYYPCHIASLPVAVNIQCHSARHQRIVI